MESGVLTRLRWRRRGAWMWPLFLGGTVGEAVLIHRLPFAGDGVGVIGAGLIAMFFNLLAIGPLASVLGWWLQRRRPGWPSVVARDRAGVACLAVVAVALALGGIAHRPAIRAERDDLAAQGAAVHEYVLAQAPVVYRRRLGQATTVRVDRHLYRTCVPGNDPQRALCLIVNTDQSPPGIRVDPNRERNESMYRIDANP
jgi:hypothetical protein